MNDNKLILYYYRDGLTEAERAEIAAQLEADASLQKRYASLSAELGEMRDIGQSAPPPDMVARWHDSIDRAATLARGKDHPARGIFHLPSFIWGTAITTVLVAGIAIDLYLAERKAVPTLTDVPAQVAAQQNATSSAFERGLQVHFRDSRRNIDTLVGASGNERELLILHIIQQNRLFAREAKENNTPELARVLRAFEPILVQLAAADISDKEAARLQRQLAFELNVMLTKLGSAPSKEADNSSESI